MYAWLRPANLQKRAFMNGRIDLTQAEAIIDIIEAKQGTPSPSLWRSSMELFRPL